MAVDSVEELRSSLKHLYEDPEFSDLTIASREAEYRVHKAIVCPRSDYFAAQCRESNSKFADDGYLSLPDDDPQAVGMVVRYFYHLDYPSEPSNDVSPPRINGHAPNTNGHNHVNGHHDATGGYDSSINGSAKLDDHQPLDKDSAKAEDTGEALDDFLPTQPQRLSKKQKKRAKANAKQDAERIGSPDPQSESVSSSIAHETSALSQNQDNHSEGGGGAVLDSKPPRTNGIATKYRSSSSVVVDDDDDNNNNNNTKSLVLHANVYALSRKYGIAGLRSLAFDKFQTEADSQWNTEEFLQAAEKVYTSCSDGDDDRKMKDVVVGMICRHGELMDKVETQKAMRTLPKDLMYDILLQVRMQGGFDKRQSV